jgi:hypothetical protein
LLAEMRDRRFWVFRHEAGRVRKMGDARGDRR